MRKLLISILFLVILGISSESILGQEPSPPILKEVSVLQGTGDVRLSWELTDSADVIIYRDSIAISAWVSIDTIQDTSITTYIDYSAMANIHVRSYRIAADVNSNTSNKTEKFHTIYLTYNYDSCLAQMNLSWNKYVDSYFEEDNIGIQRYNIYRSDNLGIFSIVGNTTNQNYSDKY